MFCLYFVFGLISFTNSQVTPLNSGECAKSALKTYVDSFLKFITDVKDFFTSRTGVIEQNRQRIKQAFQNFFRELFEERTNMGNRLVETNFNYDNDPSALFKMKEMIRIENMIENINNRTITEKLIVSHGYRAESHKVFTDDGYMLTLHRIPAVSDHNNNKLVVLYHGLLGSSEDWLILGPNRALPYFFSNAGYDVWLPNARGNRYSRAKINRSNDALDFWDFSWHEMGLYDLPAIFKYIREYTNDQVEMNFVGHGMGATTLLVFLSTWPENNFMLQSATLLAPLAFMYHVKGPLRLFYKKNGFNSSNIGAEEFLQAGAFPRQVIEKFCKENEGSCSNPLLLLANGAKEILDKKAVENIINRVPAGGSTNTIIHYAQLVKSGHFQMFDYGPAYNFKRYGDYSPPKYNLKSISVPIIIFSSSDDWLATPQDIATLKQNLPNVIEHTVVNRDRFSHIDFVWALDAPKQVYNRIFEALHTLELRTGKVLTMETAF